MLDARVVGMPWAQAGATHYHARLGLPDKSRAIKWLVICYEVWICSLDKREVRSLVPCCGQKSSITSKSHRYIQIHITSHIDMLV